MARARGLADGRYRAWGLAGLWVLATGLNLLKPFHLDDTAHLLIAEHILRDPLHPLSGTLNWLDTAEPIFVTNQPHLFFYLLAGVMAVFGTGEVALHLFLSLFTGLAIWAAHRLFSRFVPDLALFLTAALVLGPGFLINQNVMVDMPVLAMMALAVLLVTDERLSARRGAAAFAAFSAALLSKYSAVFLFPALLWGALANRRAAAWALLPVLALAGWSLFNLYDYGAVHVLNRPANEGGIVPSPKLTIALIANLGAFAVPVAALLVVASRWRLVWGALWLAGAAAFYPVILVLLARPGEPLMSLNALLFGAAVAVGAAAGARAARLGWTLWRDRGDPAGWFAGHRGDATLVLWLAGGAVFFATFPPFMATRHALLLAVPLFALACRGHLRAPGLGRAGAILLPWALVGVFVTANDIAFARFYRDQAPILADRARALAGPGAKVFTRGHWGWQWYAARAGMITYDSRASVISPGDILVDPQGISAQALADAERFETLETIVQPASIFTVLDTHRFYASGAWADAVFQRLRAREIRILRAAR